MDRLIQIELINCRGSAANACFAIDSIEILGEAVVIIPDDLIRSKTEDDIIRKLKDPVSPEAKEKLYSLWLTYFCLNYHMVRIYNRYGKRSKRQNISQTNVNTLQGQRLGERSQTPPE